MMPAPFDIQIYRGDRYSLFYQVRNKNPDGTAGAYVDLTGRTPKAQIRSTEDSPTVLAEFTATLANQTLFPGGVLLVLPSSVTTALSFSTARWDAQVADALGEPTTFLAGVATLIKDVTK